MSLEQARPHFLPSSKQPAINLARKDTDIAFQRHFAPCNILQNTDNNLKQKTYLVKYETCPVKTIKNKIKSKTCFHICLEEKKHETVRLFPTFLAQGITRDTL